MKALLFILILITGCGERPMPTYGADIPDFFIRNHWDLALEVERLYGVPAEIAIAQSAIETGWGGAVRHRNYFNITGSFNGNFYKGNDVDRYGNPITQYFRVYETKEESWHDYGRLVKRVYPHCFRCERDFLCWSTCLERYAVDIEYGYKVYLISSRLAL